MSASSARLSQNVLARLSLPLSSCCCCWLLALSPCLARCGLWRVRVCHILTLEPLTIPSENAHCASSGIQISAGGMEVAGHKSLSPAHNQLVSCGGLFCIYWHCTALNTALYCQSRVTAYCIAMLHSISLWITCQVRLTPPHTVSKHVDC